MDITTVLSCPSIAMQDDKATVSEKLAKVQATCHKLEEYKAQ